MENVGRSRQAAMEQLRRLQADVDRIRKQVGISAPGAVIYFAPCSGSEIVVVESDGFGGARVLVVEGNYPVDYMVLVEEAHTCEATAIERAAELDPDAVEEMR